MRRLRPLLLLAIGVILALVAGIYYVQKGVEQRQSPAKPKPLPANTTGTAPDWVCTKLNEAGIEVVRLSAKGFQEIADPARTLLDQVEVRVLDKDGVTFDRIKTARAVFDAKADTLWRTGMWRSSPENLPARRPPPVARFESRPPASPSIARPR